jgi:hypothetical protein
LIVNSLLLGKKSGMLYPASARSVGRDQNFVPPPNWNH